MKNILVFLFILGCSVPPNRDARICFDPSMTEEEQVIFSNALDEWKTKANPHLDDPITAQIKTTDCYWKVKAEDQITTAGTLGLTDPNQNIIFLRHQSENFQFRYTCEHELGHVFSGWRHSEFQDAVMYPSPTLLNINGLSERDLEWPNNHNWNDP